MLTKEAIIQKVNEVASHPEVLQWLADNPKITAKVRRLMIKDIVQLLQEQGLPAAAVNDYRSFLIYLDPEDPRTTNAVHFTMTVRKKENQVVFEPWD